MSARRARGRGLTWLQGGAAGLLLAACPGAVLLLAVLLCPALAFHIMNGPEQRPAARAMLLFATAACFVPLRRLVEAGLGFTAALDLLSDPSRPLLAWAAAGAGWLLCEVGQVAASMALAAKSRLQTEALERERDALREEWTFDPDLADEPGAPKPT